MKIISSEAQYEAEENKVVRQQYIQIQRQRIQNIYTLGYNIFGQGAGDHWIHQSSHNCLINATENLTTLAHFNKD